MLPDDDANREINKLRTREYLLGALLALASLTMTLVDFHFLKSKLSTPYLAVIIAQEWVVMLVVYLIIVSKMRKRKHGR
jgi:hypothetical protein